jgi:formylmethanofuran dehydrogenase subunit B
MKDGGTIKSGFGMTAKEHQQFQTIQVITKPLNKTAEIVLYTHVSHCKNSRPYAQRMIFKVGNCFSFSACKSRADTAYRRGLRDLLQISSS